MNTKQILLLPMIGLMLFTSGLAALTEKNDYTVYFSGRAVNLVTPLVAEKDALLIPAPELLGPGGCQLSWDSERNQMTAVRKSDSLKLIFTADSQVIKVNGQPKNSPLACRIFQSNFYVPLAYTAELLGIDYVRSGKKIFLTVGASNSAKSARSTAGEKVLPSPVRAPLPSSGSGNRTAVPAREEAAARGRIIFEKNIPGPPDYSGFFGRLSRRENISLNVFGRDIRRREKMVFYENELLVSLAEFFDALGGAQINREGPAVDVFWEGFSLRLQVGSDVADFGETRRRLAVEVKEINNEIFVSLAALAEYLELGVNLDSNSDRIYVAPRMTGISLEEQAGRKFFRLSFSHPGISAEISEGRETSELFIDCPGIVLDLPEGIYKTSDKDFPQLTLSRSGPDKIRVGLVLSGVKTYFMTPDAQEKQWLVTFVPWLNSLVVNQTGEVTEIKIKTTETVSPRIFGLKEPERIIMDFSGVAFKADQLIPVTSGPVERVRGSQFKTWPPVSRLVIDLADNVLFDIKSFPDDQLVVLSVWPDNKVPTTTKREPVKKFDVLKGKVIVIDPGHGGDDPGAIAGGVYEKKLTLAISQILSRRLNEAGATCLLVLEEDTSMSLADRVNFAASNRATVFISLHLNASFSKNMEGTETYYYKPQDYNLAGALQKALLEKLNTKDNSVRRARFYVLTHSKMPSALVEPVYISNEDEFKMVSDKEFQKKIADGILTGLVNYFEKNKNPGKKNKWSEE